MFNALVKKQFMELATLFNIGKRRSKSGSTGGAVLVLILYVFLGVSIASSIFFFALTLSEELLGKGADWKYFVLLDVFALFLGSFVTMFSADLTLFRAKDNEMLLSMPIPPGYILLARMLPLYIISLIFTGSVLVPEVLVYRMEVGLGLGGVVLNVVLILSLALLSLGLASVLGWLISLINSRFKGNSMVKVLASLLFLGVYFFFYFQMSKFTTALVSQSTGIADWIGKFIPPLYYLGEAHTGAPLGIVIGFATIFAIFGLIYFGLSRTFRGVVINASENTSRKTKVRAGSLRTETVSKSLLKKEIKRFLSSSSYMMNCGMGSVFMVAAAIIAIIKKDALISLLNDAKNVFPGLSNFAPGLLAIVIFLLVSTCYYTMPSISLEGKTIWILQSMPLDPMQVFMSKIKMEYILCAPGILILTTVVTIITGMSVLSWAAVIVSTLCYTTFTAFFGLWINMKRPNLDWTNEAYPIKQGLNPLICLFGEWLLTIILAVLFVLVGLFVPSEVYLLLVGLVLLAVSYAIYRWLKTRGREIFAYLE